VKFLFLFYFYFLLFLSSIFQRTLYFSVNIIQGPLIPFYLILSLPLSSYFLCFLTLILHITPSVISIQLTVVKLPVYLLLTKVVFLGNLVEYITEMLLILFEDFVYSFTYFVTSICSCLSKKKKKRNSSNRCANHSLESQI
jgi:hypothetical protein